MLVLGDPGQLPPIKGKGAFNSDTPDVLLTEVHRQAAESAIIRLATAARQGDPIACGEHDEFVWKMRRSDVGVRGLLNADQVLCGKNATRIWLNNAMKEASGFAHRYPTGGGEKVICLKNRNDLGVVNGMFLKLSDIEDDKRDPLSFSARIATEDGVMVGGNGSGAGGAHYRIYKGHFDDHVQRDPERLDRDHHQKKSLIEATWGWAITTHRAQGSQYQNVIVVDDGWGANDLDRRRCSIPPSPAPSAASCCSIEVRRCSTSMMQHPPGRWNATTSTPSSPGCAQPRRPGCRGCSPTAAAWAMNGGSPTSRARRRARTAPA
ncbi:MAG: hypothetical protein WBW73_01760 [Rhodoplanes sp.]